MVKSEANQSGKIAASIPSKAIIVQSNPVVKKRKKKNRYIDVSRKSKIVIICGNTKTQDASLAELRKEINKMLCNSVSTQVISDCDKSEGKQKQNGRLKLLLRFK